MPRDELSRGFRQYAQKEAKPAPPIRNIHKDYRELSEPEKTQLKFVLERGQFPDHILTDRLKTFIRRHHPEIDIPLPTQT